MYFGIDSTSCVMSAEYFINTIERLIYTVSIKGVTERGHKLERLGRFGYICLAKIGGKKDLYFGNLLSSEEEMLG